MLLRVTSSTRAAGFNTTMLSNILSKHLNGSINSSVSALQISHGQQLRSPSALLLAYNSNSSTAFNASKLVCLAGRSSGSSSSSRKSSSSNQTGPGPAQGVTRSSGISSSSTGGKPSKQTSKQSPVQPSKQQHKHTQQQQQRNIKQQQTTTGQEALNKPAGKSSKGAQQQSKSRGTGNPNSSSSSSSYRSSSSSRALTDSSSSSSSAPRGSPLPANAQVLVIGGGAAGLTAAYFAAQAGAQQVYVLERTREAGKKILMSGGSRCNVLPLQVDLNFDYFTDSSQSALRAVFASWNLEQCHDWLSYDVGLQLQLEAQTNKWFPASNSSREVRDKLVSACEQLGVRFVYNASVEDLQPLPSPAAAAVAAAVAETSDKGQQQQRQGSRRRWTVTLADGATVTADRVIMSTGGRSFPAVGTDGTGLNLLQGLGHKLVQQYAALTPLKGPHPGGQQLAGLTLSDVKLSALKPGSSKVAAVAQRGGLLFTHRGYSGPAILDLSHWLVPHLDQQAKPQTMPKLVVDWSGEGLETWQQRLTSAPGATTVESLLKKAGLKERLAAALAAEVGVAGKPISQLKKTERQALLMALTAWQLPVTSHEGYKKAEVTGGGVPLEQVDCRTMESRLLPGLYLCGEVLDVFGRIGGFNFYWAWVTGRMAGLAAAAQATSLHQRKAVETSGSRARR